MFDYNKSGDFYDRTGGFFVKPSINPFFSAMLPKNEEEAI